MKQVVTLWRVKCTRCGYAWYTFRQRITYVCPRCNYHGKNFDVLELEARPKNVANFGYEATKEEKSP
ncbi:MAG: hypothetical protein NZ954_08480 [Thermofilaceae archaeon]|nr:hypothetical protein [Thermofilaceae archaeon]